MSRRANRVQQIGELPHRFHQVGGTLRRILREHHAEHVLEVGLFRRARRRHGRADAQIERRGDVVEGGATVAEIARRRRRSPDVGTATRRAERQVLRGHEMQGPADLARGRGLAGGDAEVPQTNAGLGGAEEVRRLHVPVHHAGLVRRMKRDAGLPHHVTHEPEGQANAQRRAPPVIELGQIDAVDVLLDEVRRALVDAGVDGADDEGAGDARHQARFLDDATGLLLRLAGRERGAQHLQDDGDRQDRMLGEPHLAHPPLSQATPDLVVADSFGQGGHRCSYRWYRAPRPNCASCKCKNACIYLQ